MATEQIKFLSLDVFGTNEQWIYDYIKREDAKSLKTVALSSDNSKILFYRIESPTTNSVPAFEIEIPSTVDTSIFIQKVLNAKNNNIPTLTASGTIVDSGISINDIVTQNDFESKIIEEISKQSHLSKQIVTTIPKASEAKENVVYLLKVTDATGKDIYEEYTLIGGEVVMIGDTSTNLDDYLTKQETIDRIATAKQEAINSATSTASADATTKANQALVDAKAYTDQKNSALTTRVTNVETNVTNIQSNITTLSQTQATHGDRITALESATSDIEVATVEEALALFNSIFV